MTAGPTVNSDAVDDSSHPSRLATLHAAARPCRASASRHTSVRRNGLPSRSRKLIPDDRDIATHRRGRSAVLTRQISPCHAGGFSLVLSCRASRTGRGSSGRPRAPLPLAAGLRSPTLFGFDGSLHHGLQPFHRASCQIARAMNSAARSKTLSREGRFGVLQDRDVLPGAPPLHIPAVARRSFFATSALTAGPVLQCRRPATIFPSPSVSVPRHRGKTHNTSRGLP